MNNRFAIYTVITGCFDNLKQPLIEDHRFDYILFTDTELSFDTGVWQVRRIPYQHNNTRQHSRYPKAHPEVVLPEYSASLYIDGNLVITSQWVYNRCIELYEQGVEWAGIRHPWRNTIYEEIDWMLKSGWVHDYDVLDWYLFLLKNHYPSEKELALSFLFENSIIFRRNCDNVKKVNDLWWWTIENYVSRDQFSLMFALWKVPDIKMDFFFLPEDIAWKNTGHFHYFEHNPHHRVLKWSIWERIRHRCWRVEHGEEEPYTHLLDIVCDKKNPYKALQVWTLDALLKNGYKVLWEMIKCRIPFHH